MSSTRADLLAAAARLMAGGDWPRTSMARVAAEAGVSRQTAYNEFGSRDGLVAAVAATTAARFRTGTVGAAAAAADAGGEAMLTAAMVWALAEAAQDPILAAALTDDAAGLLPFLTTRSAELLPPIAADLAAVMGGPDADWACEVALRLTVSHLLSPTHSDDDFVARVADLVSPLVAG